MATGGGGGGGQGDPFAIFDQGGSGGVQTTDPFSIFDQPSPSPSPAAPAPVSQPQVNPSQNGTSPAVVGPAGILGELTGAQVPQANAGASASLQRPLYSNKQPRVPKSGTQFISKNDSAPVAGQKAGNIVDEAIKRAGSFFNQGTPAQCAAWVRDAYQAVGVKLKTSKQPLDWKLWGKNTGPNMANSLVGSDVGEIVRDPNQLKPGDILSFDNTYGDFPQGTITHVGIYVGDGEMVHRPTADKPVERVNIKDSGMKFRAGVRPYREAGDTKTMVEGVVRKSGFTSDQDVSLMMKLFDNESGFRAHDYNGRVLTSRAGARGIGQVMPATAAPYLAKHGWTAEQYDQNPVIQTTIATEITQDLLRRYDGNWAKALAAYNGGPGAVAEAETNGGWSPNSKVGTWYTETLPYVAKALHTSPEQAMKWIANGGGPVAQVQDPGLQERQAQTAFQKAVSLSMVPVHIASMGLTLPLTDPNVQEVNQKGGQGPFSSLFNDAKESTKYVAHGFLLALDGIGGILSMPDKAISGALERHLGNGLLGQGLDFLIGSTAAVGVGRAASRSTDNDLLKWLVQQTAPDGWQTAQREFPTQMRGGQDFVTWMLGTLPRNASSAGALGPLNKWELGPNKLLDPRAWEANSWSFGMEFPTLAAQTVALEFLGPSEVMFGLKSAGPGLLARESMKPVANAIGTAGGGGILWAMANKTGIGRQLGREFFKNVATWGGLGALQAGSIAAGQAMEAGRPVKEVLASAIVTGMFGYLMGVGIPLGLHAAAAPVKAANTNLLQPAVQKALQLAADSPVRYELERSFGDIIGRLDKATGYKLSARIFARIVQNKLNTTKIAGERLLQDKMEALDSYASQKMEVANAIRKVVADRQRAQQQAVQQVQQIQQVLAQHDPGGVLKTVAESAAPLEQEAQAIQQALRSRPPVADQAKDQAWVQQFSALGKPDKPIVKSNDLKKLLETRLSEAQSGVQQLLDQAGKTPDDLVTYQAGSELLKQATDRAQMFDQDPLLGNLQETEFFAATEEHFANTTAAISKWLGQGNVSPVDPALHKILELPVPGDGGFIKPEEFAQVSQQYSEGIEAIVGSRKFLDPVEDYIENITSRTSRAFISSHSPMEAGIRYERLIDEAKSNLELVQANMPKEPKLRPEPGETPSQFRNRAAMESGHYLQDLQDYDARVADARKTYQQMLEGQKMYSPASSMERVRGGVVSIEASRISEQMRAEIEQAIPQGVAGLEQLVKESEVKASRVMKDIGESNRGLLPPNKVKKRDLNIPKVKKPREFTGEGPVPPEQFDFDKWATEQQRNYYDKLKKYEAAKAAVDAARRRGAAIRGDEDYDTMRAQRPPRPIQKQLLALKEKELALQADLENIRQGPEVDITGTHSKATRRLQEASTKQRIQVENELLKVQGEKEALLNQYRGDQGKFFRYMKAREEFLTAKTELKRNPPPRTPKWWEADGGGSVAEVAWRPELQKIFDQHPNIRTELEDKILSGKVRIAKNKVGVWVLGAEDVEGRFYIDSTGAIPNAVKLTGHSSKAEAQAALKQLQEDIRASRSSTGKGPTIDRIRSEVEAKNAERYNRRQARVDKYQAEKAKRQGEIADYQQKMADIEALPEVQKYRAYRSAVESANQLRTLYLDHGVDHGGFIEANVPISWIEPSGSPHPFQEKGPVMLEDVSPSNNLTVFGGHAMLDAAAKRGEEFVKAVVPRNVWQSVRAAKVPQSIQDMLPHTFGGGTGVSAAQQLHATSQEWANKWYEGLNPSRRGELVANELQNVLDTDLQTPSQKRLMEMEMMLQQPIASWAKEIPADFAEVLEGNHLEKVGFQSLLEFHAPATLRQAVHENTFNAFMHWDDQIGNGNALGEMIAAEFDKGLEDSISRAMKGPKTLKEFRADSEFREQMVDAVQALTTDSTLMQQFLQQHPHMQNPLRAYFGLYNTMEHFKLLSPELDSLFNDVAFPHIWQTLREMSTGGKEGSPVISTRYASEFARKIPTIAEGRRIYQKALYGDSEGGRQSVGLMNAPGWKNAEPKTIRAREDYYIGLQPAERCRVLGLDPTVDANILTSENILMGIGLRDPITDPTKVLRLQVSAMMRADANRNLIKNLSSIPIPGAGMNPRTGKPYMMVEYYGNHETPGLIPVLRKGEIRPNSPFPEQMTANYKSLSSDDFGMNEHSTLKFSGMDVPAKNLYIHPDAAALMTERFAAKASELGGTTKAINELMRAMKLAGSPVPHMNNLYSQHFSSFAALAIHHIDKSLRARNLSGVLGGLKDLAMSPVDAVSTVAAGNRIGMDLKMYADAVRSGVNLVTWNNQAKAAVDQAIRHLGQEGPDIFEPGELTSISNSPARIMEGAKDAESVDSKIRKALDFNPVVSAVKQGEGVSAVAKALGAQAEAAASAPLKLDYIWNKYFLFNTARQAQVAAFHHWAAVFWEERGNALLDKGMPADAALSLIKREAAQYTNIVSGSMNHYMDPAWARNATYGNLPVVGNLFAAMAPGWLRTKNHQMMAVFNSLLERTWVGKQLLRPVEATGGVAEFARVMDPGMKQFLEGQWKRSFAVGMVGGLMGVQMLNMMLNQGRPTWKSNPNNPEKWTSPTVGDKTLQWPFWGANKEAVKILDKTASGDLIGGLMQQFTQNMFTPLAEDMFDIARNQDRTGQHIFNPDNSYGTLGERAGDVTKYVASRHLNLGELASIKLNHGVFSRASTPEWVASLLGMSPSNAPTPGRERAAMEEAEKWYAGKMAAENAADLQLVRRSQDTEAMDRICQRAMIDGIPSQGRFKEVMDLQFGDGRYRMSGKQVRNMIERQIDPLGSAMKGLSPAGRAVLWDRIQYWEGQQAQGPLLQWQAGAESQEGTP